MSDIGRLQDQLSDQGFDNQEVQRWTRDYQQLLDQQRIAAMQTKSAERPQTMTKNTSTELATQETGTLDNLRNGLTNTAKMSFDAAQRGIALAGATNLNRRISSITRKGLSKFIPEEVLESPVGTKLSEFMAPLFLHFAAELAGDKLPYAKQVKEACSLALQGATFENIDTLLENLAPIFEEVANGNLSAVNDR